MARARLGKARRAIKASPAADCLRYDGQKMTRERAKAILDRLGVAVADDGGGETLESVDPPSGRVQGGIHALTRAQYDARGLTALRRVEEWRMRPGAERE